MTVPVRTSIRGLDELTAAMGRFGEDVDQELLENVLREVAKPIRKSMQMLAPRNKSGGVSRQSLHKSIRISRATTRRQRAILQLKKGQAYIWVGSKAPHAHLIERGHFVKARGPNRKGSPPLTGARWVGPQPFVKPAWDMNRGQTGKRFAAGVRPALKRITNAWKRDARTGRVRGRTRRQFRGL